MPKLTTSPRLFAQAALTDWRRVPEMAAVRRRLETNLARHPHPSSAGAARLRAKLSSVEQTIGRSRLRPGQLVIVDEASLASTFVLDEIVSAARQSGAKLLARRRRRPARLDRRRRRLLAAREGQGRPRSAAQRRAPVRGGLGAGGEPSPPRRRRDRARRLRDPRTHRRWHAGRDDRRCLRRLASRRRRRQVEPHDRRRCRHGRRAEPVGEG